MDGFWTGDGIAFDVTQASRPFDDGSFPLNGTAAYMNTSCFPSARVDGFVRGRIFMPVVTSGSRRVEYRGNVELDQSRTYVAGRLAMGQSCPELPEWEGTHVARLVRQ